VKGADGRDKIVVQEVRKVHEPRAAGKPPTKPVTAKPAKDTYARISHVGQLKSLNSYLAKKKKREQAAGGPPRLGHIYGVDNAMVKLYTEMENARRASDKKKDDLVKTLQKMKIGEEDLMQYTKLDHFNAKQHLNDVQLSKSRHHWCGPDTYTANDKADKNLKYLFSDPSRLPEYDQKVGGWHLSQKFAVEFNEEETREDSEASKHTGNPFMAEYI